MDTNKLRTFFDLAKTLNFSETAENLFVSQSSVSKQIHSLEKELGVGLFVRDNKHVKLSLAGHLILPNVQAILKQEQEIDKKLQEISEKKSETIKIAAIPTFATYKPFGLITKYMNQHPKIDFQLEEVESDRIESLLKEKQVNFAFIRSLNDKPPLPSILVKKERFALCVAEDDPLAKKELINLADIKGESFIMLSKNSMLYQPVITLCQKAGFRPKIVFTSERVTSIFHMIRKHQGVSILMAPGQKFHGLKFIPIKPTMKSYLYLLRIQKNLTANEREFWEYLKTSLNPRTK